MRFALAVVLAVALTAVAVNGASRHAEIPTSVRLGYFSGRSGNVVFTESQMKAPSAAASFVDPSGRFIETSLLPSSFSLYDIANTLALAFGTVVPGVAKQASFSAPFLKTDVFSRPLASVMVGVKELSQEDAQALNLNSLKAAMPVTGASQPYDSLSAAVSLSTSNPPAVHGIVAKQWKNSAGEEVTAFAGDRIRSTPQVASLADIVAQTFDGRSTIVSASADAQYSSAFCPRFSLRQAHPEWNTICFGYKNHQFVDSDNAAAGSESKQELLDRFARGLFPSVSNVKVSYSPETKQFEVTVPNAAAVTFSMADHESFALFAELQFISDLVAKIDTLATARDEVPDLFSFTISALEGVVARFGHNSAQFRAAAILVDGVVGHMMSRLFATYNNRVLASVVTWGHVHHRSSDNIATEKAVVASVLQSFGASSEFEWPSASLHVSASPLSKVCDELTNSLSAFDVQVHCPTLSPASVSSFLESSVRSNANVRTLADAPTDNDVQRYQIALWFSIGIVLVLFAAIYSVCYMDLKADTLLYSKFNPHWKKNH